MNPDFKPNHYDKLFLFFLVLLGTYTLYGWFLDAFLFARKRVKRVYRTIEYAYLTDDHKVVEPKNFGASVE